MFTFLLVFPFCSNSQSPVKTNAHRAVAFPEQVTVRLFFLFLFLKCLVRLVYRKLKKICVRTSDKKMYVCPVPRSIEYPSWDWRESRDFDELNHILQESKKLGKALESLSRSEWLQPGMHTPWALFNISSHTELKRRPFCKCHCKSKVETGSSS